MRYGIQDRAIITLYLRHYAIEGLPAGLSIREISM